MKQALENAGFRVESGYPAHKAVHLTDTVAAVNLKGMDGSTVTQVLVTILTPRALGLEQCQSRSAEAVQALMSDGNQWGFEGWRYESGIDCWAIEIGGIPVLVEEKVEPEGYTVSVEDSQLPYVTDFVARQVLDRRLIRPHWESAPSGVTPGKQGWNLELTQLIPAGQPEPEEGEEPFALTVHRGGIRYTYSACRWAEYSSRQMPEGTRIVRKALALSREVTTDG